MNWMRVYLRRTGWKALVLGAAAGLWAAFLGESALLGLGLLGMAPGLQAAMGGLVVGLIGGALLAPINEGLHRHRRRQRLASLWGAAMGALTGLVGIGLARWWIFHFGPAPHMVFGIRAAIVWAFALPVVLGLLGGAIGLGSGIGARSRTMALRRLRYGVVGGILAGIPVAAAEFLLPRNPWVHCLALALWGGVVAQVLFLTEKRTARHWLRLLTGPGEDDFFPLVTYTVRLGKSEHNEVPLLHYAEVYPMHCRIDRIEDQYRIIDDEMGGPVYVNFRQVQEQPLKPGDLIKIGSALLQYGEAP